MKKSVVFLLILLSSATAFSQWTPTGGPIGDITCYDIVSNDTAILASLPCGTFVSYDNGTSWQNTNIDVFYNSTFFKNTIYIVLSNFIYKVYCVNGTWHQIKVLTCQDNINDLYSDNNKIYAPTRVQGLMSSANGNTWSGMSTSGLPLDTSEYFPMPPYYWIHLSSLSCVSGNSQYLFVGGKHGVYRSSISSSGWSNIHIGIPQVRPNKIHCLNSNVFAIINNQIYISQNNGYSWTLLPFKFHYTTNVTRITNSGNNIFFLTDKEGLWVTSDTGLTWSSANSGLMSLYASGLTFHDSIAYLGGGDGVYMNYPSWINTSNNIYCSVITATASNSNCIAAVSNHNVHIMSDYGVANWINSTSSLPIGNIRNVINFNDRLIFSATPNNGTYTNCTNYLSIDNGNTWASISTLPYNGYSYLLRTNGSKIIAVNYYAVFISLDTGQTWNNITPPPAIAGNYPKDALFTGNEIYLTSYGNRNVVKSSDYGSTWFSCNSGLPNSQVYKLSDCQGILFATTDNTPYRSLDGGLNWQACGLGLPPNTYNNPTTIQDFAYDNTNFYLCTINKVFMSGDQGYSWVEITSDLPSLPNSSGGSLLVRDNFLYFGTSDKGVWKRSVNSLPTSSGSLPYEQKFIVYPNPVEDVLHLEYRGHDAIVQLEVIDCHGQVIFSGAGNLTSIQMNQFPDGLYFIKATTSGGKVHCKKILKTY